MINPVFWLGLSFLLVAVSIVVVLVAALPTLQELARAARSAEKLFDTLRRDLPPTLEAIRLTGLEISDLTDDVSDSVKSAGKVVKQVDQSLDSAKKQAEKIEVGTRSVFVGVKTAWKTLLRPSSNRRSSDRLTDSAINQRRVSQNYSEENYPSNEAETEALDSIEEYPTKPSKSYYTYNTDSKTPPPNPRNVSKPIEPEDFDDLESEDF